MQFGTRINSEEKKNSAKKMLELPYLTINRDISKNVRRLYVHMKYIREATQLVGSDAILFTSINFLENFWP
jgi:hypothetical protein